MCFYHKPTFSTWSNFYTGSTKLILCRKLKAGPHQNRRFALAFLFLFSKRAVLCVRVLCSQALTGNNFGCTYHNWTEVLSGTDFVRVADVAGFDELEEPVVVETERPRDQLHLHLILLNCNNKEQKSPTHFSRIPTFQQNEHPH